MKHAEAPRGQAAHEKQRRTDKRRTDKRREGRQHTVRHRTGKQNPAAKPRGHRTGQAEACTQAGTNASGRPSNVEVRPLGVEREYQCSAVRRVPV
ncbi:hypothetical protein F4553_002852 [Allocatelliglobosispora scoriae]|uniref:Uncharacterized protein n=1 Tax=Allocatelliglobosispora scoriae TaxID=643052 RepID=A0A841BRD2_9ACTN|nr:hypothetical protein [Allocatelliglobosispora scoriae]